MTDQDKHIEKLKKLLALAASGNPHEAALALRCARKLMDVHGITHSDIAMSDIDETISHYWPTGSLRPPRYMLGLMNIIREAFGVNSIIHPGTYPGVGFYGNREEAAMATPRAMRGFVKGRTSDCTARSVGRNNRNWRPDDYAIR